MESYAVTWCERCGQRPAVAEIASSEGAEAVRLCASCSTLWEATHAWAAGAGDLAARLSRPGEREAMLCPRCGYDVEDMVRRGRVGCPECYGAFEEPVTRLLAQSMPHPAHGGKWPRRWRNGRSQRPLTPDSREPGTP